MSKKYMSVKTLAIPIISLIVLISQVMPTFAMSSNEVTDLMQTSPTVTVEFYTQAQAPSLIAYNEAVLGEFTDVPKTAWYYKDVMQAKAAGFVQGIGHGLYGPSTDITYGHFITTLVRVYKQDSDIPEVVNGSHWADKYIAVARELGMVGKTEKVDANKPISRQEMMRYTINLLGLEPAESADIIFADVKPADAAYINTAYKEYLTEGAGRNSTGIKVFGFNRTSLRSEMAAMVNRVYEYKQNPTAFKEQRAAQRAADDAAYEQQQSNYIIFNGFKVPKDCMLYDTQVTGDDFSCWAWWETSPSDFNTIQQILSSKLDSTVVKQAVAFGKTKVKQGQYIQKTFITGKYEIQVNSARTSDKVTFNVISRE